MNRQKILFIGFMFNPEYEQFYKMMPGKPLQKAANNYQLKFIEGLRLNSINNNIEIEILALPSFGSYLISYSQLRIREMRWKKKEITFKSPKFTNLPLIKHIQWINFIINEVKRISSDYNEVRVIFYSYNLLWNLVCLITRFKSLTFFSSLIITDLPKNLQKVPLSKIQQIDYVSLRHYIQVKLMSVFNYYIVVSDGIRSILRLKDDNTVVIDGFADRRLLLDAIKLVKVTKECKTVRLAYSGNLGHEFGILNLVKAFSMFRNEKTELHIYGSPITNKLIQLISEDSRIKFHGNLSLDDLYEEYKTIDAFIIPRSGLLGLNNYSHPSKVLEYMSTMKWVVMFEMPTIMDYSYERLILLNSNNPYDEPDILYRAIKNNYDKFNKSDFSICHKTLKFIINNKLEYIQIKKLFTIWNN